tara:strand:+ start:1219 stop:1527 length:309 start_codon:yes stop_codon:yes gene_type:complete
MKKKQVFRLKEERQELYKIIENLNFKEQKKILRKVDARIVRAGNTYLGNERVHSIDYLTKFPNQYESEAAAKIFHLSRQIFAKLEVDELFKGKRSESIKVVK